MYHLTRLNNIFLLFFFTIFLISAILSTNVLRGEPDMLLNHQSQRRGSQDFNFVVAGTLDAVMKPKKNCREYDK